jgi:hypothetical protein
MGFEGWKARCRGPVPFGVVSFAGSLAVSWPVFASKANWKIASGRVCGTKT